MPAAPTSWDDLPRRLPARLWLATVACFLVIYYLMFSWVHIWADMRPCLAPLRDPVLALIPRDPRWFAVTGPVWALVTLGVGLGGVLIHAGAHGDHRPAIRWGLALTIMAVMRSLTILLIPACRADMAPGTIALCSVPTVHLGALAIPFHLSASNDLVFSGHVAELVLLLMATRSWPRPLRAGLWAFTGLQAYALMATRGHYLWDILAAVPCAWLADQLALTALRLPLARNRLAEAS
ncbi:MAG: hypothetical protein IT370_24735 [Deltaproteobacteria bacterium]|nr:hypothetical protein [Deltaproteobacteria bacterium]